MLELSRMVARYRAAQRTSEPMALATLVETEGSTYRRPGARLLVADAGEVVGLLSGGCLEADIAAHAARLSAAEPIQRLTYDLRGDDEVDLGLGLGCEGKLTILLERIDGADPSNPMELLARYCEEGGEEPAAYAVVWGEGHTAPRLLWTAARTSAVGFDDPALVERLAQAAARAARSRRPALLAQPRAFVHPLPRRTSLLLFGAGPDAAPVVQQAKALGWRVVLRDHREAALLRPELAACDELRHVPLERLAEEAAAACASAALVMTHNLRVDTEILSGLCRSDVAYIGLLGPRHRAQRIREELEQRGLATGRLHGPTGLDIGAEGPEAIALAIVAEIHAVLQGRSGGSLRDRAEPIHERAA